MDFTKLNVYPICNVGLHSKGWKNPWDWACWWPYGILCSPLSHDNWRWFLTLISSSFTNRNQYSRRKKVGNRNISARDWICFNRRKIPWVESLTCYPHKSVWQDFIWRKNWTEETCKACRQTNFYLFMQPKGNATRFCTYDVLPSSSKPC